MNPIEMEADIRKLEVMLTPCAPYHWHLEALAENGVTVHCPDCGQEFLFDSSAIWTKSPHSPQLPNR